MNSKKTNINRLLWVDLEMTGLDPSREVIIECAAIVTDMNFKILETYETVVKQEQSFLDSMDDWNKKHHGASGLTAKVSQGREPKLVEDDLLQLIARHWVNEAERPILTGNSISQDRSFISRYWPRLNEKLHYRMLDVSSWKIIFNNKYDKKFEKQDKHRALDDIRASIAELQFYLTHITPNK